MSEVKWAKKALDFLDKLDKSETERIVKKIDNIKEMPARLIRGLVDKDFGKIRIGDYRLFVDLILEEDTLIIRSIRHRRNAYKQW